MITFLIATSIITIIYSVTRDFKYLKEIELKELERVRKTK